MSTITTHVLDTALGRPAAGVSVMLERVDAGQRSVQIGAGVTDADGRLANILAPGEQLESGEYRLRFATGPYFARDGRECFYPAVVVEFKIAGAGHYHVPLLLNPYGYTTYRGS